jgi:hypothetical protein
MFKLIAKHQTTNCEFPLEMIMNDDITRHASYHVYLVILGFKLKVKNAVEI